MLKSSYSFEKNVFPVNKDGSVDLLLRFNGEAEATGKRKLNISLVIDRSGSMAGNSLKHALNAAKSVIDALSEDDTVSVVVFDDKINTIIAPQNPTDKGALKKTLNSVRAGGITNLFGGWTEGCKHVEANFDPSAINRILILTDGQMNCGITDQKRILGAIGGKGGSGIVTTTLGFGSWFQEDLLTSMASVSNGNFYFIQTKEDATEVFTLELESLKSMIAQNLTVELDLKDGVTMEHWLNLPKEDKESKKLVMNFGSVFSDEDKLVGLSLKVPAFGKEGTHPVVAVKYSGETVDDAGAIHQIDGAFDVALGLSDVEEGFLPAAVDIAKLKIAQVKHTALHFVDNEDYPKAEQALHALIDEVEGKGLQEHFEIAEEVEQLHYFAGRFSGKKVSSDTRKELKDQAFQGLSRNRKDLAARGTEISQEVRNLPVVADAEGVELICVKEKGKLRVKVVSDGFDHALNVQFPRAIRADGAKYVVAGLKLSKNGSFYRVDGDVKRLVKAGEADPLTVSRSSRVKTGKASKAKSLSDLEVTDTVGDGILVQCVKAGSKIRARVVSDGYEPDWNMRFPRAIRQEGLLFVVDEIKVGPNGKSYIACGKIKVFKQS